MKYTFDDVLLEPQYSDIESRADVDISSSVGNFKLELPVFSSNMDTITDHKMAKYINQKGGMGVLHRFMPIKDNVNEYLKYPNCFVSIGITDKETERFWALKEAGATKFCIDVAHGHTLKMTKVIDNIRKNIPNAIIMAGNVATGEGAAYLAEAGANLIKVGIGPGSVCTTRIKTGHGMPQLSAIMACCAALYKHPDVGIVADGGMRNPGDIVKALAFGANYVMLGGMLAGTYYTPGEVKTHSPNGYYIENIKVYRGMASKEANEDMFGGLTDWKTAEGVSLTVKAKSEKETEYIIQDIIGGIRSGLTYSGAKNLEELRANKKFSIISTPSLMESHPHHGKNNRS